MDKRHHLLALRLSRVTEGPECHVHSGSKASHGYPQATGLDTRSAPAHRVRWLLEVGEIPAGMMVLHNCNNKQCVRLDHLRLGSHVENMDDVARVGHPCRKLTDEQAAFVRGVGDAFVDHRFFALHARQVAFVTIRGISHGELSVEAG